MSRKVPIVMDREKKAEALQGAFANHSHYTRSFEDDVEVVLADAITGEEIRLIGRLFSGVLSEKALKQAHDHIKSIKTPITQRGRVVGKNSMMPRINGDGSVSDMREVPKTVRERCGYSDTIGYLGPSQLNPQGRLTSYTKTHKKARPALTPVLREIDKIFYEEYPAVHAWEAEGFPGNDIYNWYDQMGDQTAFSSCYGNNMVRSAYHPDAANLSGSLSALFTMGDYEGGGLVLPRFGVCFNLQPGDLLLFHGDDIHGVLPFKGERLSGVFFSAASHMDFWAADDGPPIPGATCQRVLDGGKKCGNPVRHFGGMGKPCFLCETCCGKLRLDHRRNFPDPGVQLPKPDPNDKPDL
jgi:hypothetical protein